MHPEDRFPPTAFTETFVEQLSSALLAVPSREAGGWTVERAHVLLQASVPGGQRRARVALECLAALGLVEVTDGVVARSRPGSQIRKDLRVPSSASLARHIIRSGFMASQVRTLREVLALADEGYRCSRHQARTSAPQLLGLLARLDGVIIAGEVVFGSDGSAELDSMWNELVPSSRIDWGDRERHRKAVGDRAELYSMQFERSRRLGALTSVNWVSRDDDGLGYDIEVVGEQTRRIEVKGSSGPEIIFYLTAREVEKAGLYGADYELHFWGRIDLKGDQQHDYERLRALGFPLIVADPVSELTNEPWEMAPSQYRVATDASLGSPEIERLLAGEPETG